MTPDREPPVSHRDRDGYLPIAQYGAIGDGASVALVGDDGAIDWLAVGNLGRPTIFGALLDTGGGRFELRPDEPFRSEQRYLPETNVLETRYWTQDGELRVVDALNAPGESLLNWTELVRRVECTRGQVAVRWSVTPRSLGGADAFCLKRHRGIVMARRGEEQVAVLSWGLGETVLTDEEVSSATVLREGESGLIAITGTVGAALPLPGRVELEHRLQSTIDRWRAWVAEGQYPSIFGEAMKRSALALRLVVMTRTGAIAAAPTTSLPERVGGDKNWDYRFCWIRDTAFTLDALIRLGYRAGVHSAFRWMIRSSSASAPKLPVLYTLDGTVPDDDEYTPDLAGYRGSRPVRFGNQAASQLQLGSYGDLFETAFLYASQGNALDPGSRHTMRGFADEVCRLWRRKDAGIWELRGDRRHYTASKMGCWAALDRAIRMVDLGELDGDRDRWDSERAHIREFVHRRCWSDERSCYTMYAGGEALDAAVLRAVPWGFFHDQEDRLRSTVRAIQTELSAGPLLYRYTGMRDEEGCFTACSFWLVHALIAIGEEEQAEAVTEAVIARATPLGLLSEEIDPDSGEMLGNYPQALSHLALISAAHRLSERRGEAGSGRVL